jgi:hypothetical protein
MCAPLCPTHARLINKIEIAAYLGRQFIYLGGRARRRRSLGANNKDKLPALNQSEWGNEIQT